MDQKLIDKYFRGKCTHSEAEKVVEWFSTTEGQQFLDKEIERDVRALNEFGEHFEIPQTDSNALFARIQQSKSQQFGFKEVNNKSTRPQWKVAASIVLILGVLSLSLGLYFEKWKSETKIVKTAKTQEKTFFLPDSSKVVLHHNSSVIYTKPFDGKREIDLKGEAYFEVEHDEKNPFIVYVDSSYVKVLGTKFVVSEYSNSKGVEVAVKSGRVELGLQNNSDGGSRTIDQLTSGTSIEIRMNKVGIQSRGGKPQISKEVKSDELLDWVQGKMIFRNTPLRNVLADLENRYGVRIIVNDSEILDNRFTSSFDNESLNQVMTVLKITFDIKMRRVRDTLYLSK